MARKIQFKRGLKANLPKLSPAEMAFTTDEKKAYIGDGNENIRLLDQKDKTEINTQLTEKASKQDLQNIGNASPKGVYPTLTALQTAFPTGSQGVYVVSEDGKWYYWNGTVWTPGGIYQATLSAEFPATNMISNSGFSNGASGWGSSSSNFSTGNGIATMVALKQNDYIRSPNINRIADNKYYVFSRFKSTSDKVGVHSNAVLISGATHSGNGQFERKSVIFPATSSMENWVVGIIDTRQSDWDSTEVDYVGVINLTATFGIGKEPTLEKMDEIMSKYPNGHFENTVSPLFGAKELYEKISTVQSTTFVDQDTNKTFNYGFKQKDGHLVFVYEEAK